MLSMAGVIYWHGSWLLGHFGRKRNAMDWSAKRLKLLANGTIGRVQYLLGVQGKKRILVKELVLSHVRNDQRRVYLALNLHVAVGFGLLDVNHIFGVENQHLEEETYGVGAGGFGFLDIRRHQTEGVQGRQSP